ncbi:Retrotransposon gag protein [Popillia japonica]|uniref:Retrotransposon gag protein n=1 Tax=Popillia japonica TaxID=7064 RepID=A0AAW1JDS1_POPJA
MAYSLRANKYDVDLVLDKDAFVRSGKTPRSPPSTTVPTSAPYTRNTQQQTGTQSCNIQNCTISTMSILRNPILPKFVGPLKFDPSEHDAVNFLKAYTSAAEYNGWDDNLKLCYFPNFMTGSAEDWFRSFAKRNPNAGWLDTFHEFKVKFIGPRYADELEIRLFTKKQKPDESIRDYFYNTLSPR